MPSEIFRGMVAEGVTTCLVKILFGHKETQDSWAVVYLVSDTLQFLFSDQLRT